MGERERFELPDGDPEPSVAAESSFAGADFPPVDEPLPGRVQAEEPAAPIDPKNVRELGKRLAEALMAGGEAEGYQPVVIFGTNNSGKTALLLSLFARVMSDAELDTGLSLDDPLLSLSDPIAKKMYEEAELTFENRTQDFIAGKPIEKTAVSLPFFIPVTFVPRGKQTIRFAFLESSGEWYRPNRDGGKLFPKLRDEIEGFIFHYQGPIIFLYLLPYTQINSAGDRGEADTKEIGEAALAMKGMLDAYNRAREHARDKDQHLMLVTKWDVRSRKSSDRADDLEADRGDLMEFCNRHYSQALAGYKTLGLRSDQTLLNAYCAGFMNEHGVLQIRRDDEAWTVAKSYPVRLWTWFYKTALRNQDLTPVSPFPEPPKPLGVIRFITAFLDKLTN